MYSKKNIAKSGVKRKAEESLSDSSSSDLEEIDISDEESENEPDIECDGWDRNCKVVEINIKTNKITGFHLMPTCLPKPKSIEDKQPTIRKGLRDSLEAEFKENWNSEKSIINESFEIIISPWKVCLINGLLEDDSILKDVRQEFYELSWNKRKMDLYDFHQSVDLKYLHSQKIARIYNFLKHDVMNFVAELMDLKLTHISATCSFYTDTDYLLVHDDRRDDRVIAFVLYISDVYDWKESWGGALQLFNCDDDYQPRQAEKDIFPKNNQLILFPVSTVSYHQVDEVTIKNFSRYSINGWFHGKVTAPNVDPISPPFTGLYSNTFIGSKVCDINLNQYINEMYLMQENIKDIQSQIEEFSEISLPNYFKAEFYERVGNVLLGDELKWKFVGPPNRVHYEVLDDCNKIGALRTLLEVFQSEVMFKLLECYTELEYSGKDAGMKYEVQRWTPGCYSLLSDYDWNSKQELDIILYFGCKGVVGGEVQYVMQEEEVQQALVTLEHNKNTLNVVFRDSARINGYVSKHTKQTFYALVCTYTENKV